MATTLLRRGNMADAVILQFASKRPRQLLAVSFQDDSASKAMASTTPGVEHRCSEEHPASTPEPSAPTALDWDAYRAQAGKRRAEKRQMRVNARVAKIFTALKKAECDNDQAKAELDSMNRLLEEKEANLQQVDERSRD